MSTVLLLKNEKKEVFFCPSKKFSLAIYDFLSGTFIIGTDCSLVGRRSVGVIHPSGKNMLMLLKMWQQMFRLDIFETC